MRIHTNTITLLDLRDAVREASHISGAVVWLEREDEHGSRTHARAFDVILEGDGTANRRRRNFGTAQTYERWEVHYAASYEQWGYFLGYLYALDPTMKCTDHYKDAADFHAKTGGQFPHYAPAV